MRSYYSEKVSKDMTSFIDIPCIPLSNYLAITLSPSNPTMHPSRLYELFHDYVEGEHIYERNPYFYKAIQKYGWDNFKHEILFSNLTQEEAERYEKNLISEYRNGGKCYNILDGGLAAVVDTSKKVYQYTLEGKFLSLIHI